jgi:type IV secretion system protein VirB10
MSAEQETNPGTVSQIRNDAQAPPGVSAKRRQTILTLAGGGLVVAVIAFSNSASTSAPKPKATNSGSNNAVSPASPKTIQQYAKQLDDDTRGLAQERARAEQMRMDALRLNAAQQNPNQNPYAPATPAPAQSIRQSSPEEAMRMERRKREEDSLRASNIALSFRKDQPQNKEVSPTAELADVRQLIDAQKAALMSTLQPVAPQQHVPAAPGPKEQPEEKEPTPKKKAEDPDLQLATGKSFLLFQGTIIETVLTNRLNGSFSGPVNVLVTTAVYSHDGQHILIPQGTRLLGDVQRVSATGQQRLAVMFHRMIMPDGYAANLDQFKGLNQIGETGLKDQANQHYLQIFGTSLALGAVAGIGQAGGNYGYNTSGTDLYRRGVSESLSSSGTRVLDRFLNVLPTITIREGHRIKVYLTDDLMLPAYENHRLPGDL